MNAEEFDAKLDLLALNTQARRNLKKDALRKLYTEEELEEMFTTYEHGDRVFLGNLRWSAKFEADGRTATASKPRLIRKWTPHEDEFLEATYMYLTDSVIALALNMPVPVVLARRRLLGLTKHISTSLEVIIWAERENFEEDVRKYNLTKARPEAFPS